MKRVKKKISYSQVFIKTPILKGVRDRLEDFIYTEYETPAAFSKATTVQQQALSRMLSGQSMLDGRNWALIAAKHPDRVSWVLSGCAEKSLQTPDLSPVAKVVTDVINTPDMDEATKLVLREMLGYMKSVEKYMKMLSEKVNRLEEGKDLTGRNPGNVANRDNADT